MSRKLKYKIISCSSEEPEFPVSSLLFNGSNGGWQTKRFCTYPQQITFQFYGVVHIDKIQLISNGKKIPSQVDILYFLPFSPGHHSEQRFQKYGYLNFNRNENSQLKQQKSIMVDIKCLYIRFLFHKPHHSKENFFSQVGIQQVSIFGTDTKNNFAVVEKAPRQIGQAAGSKMHGMDIPADQDPFIYEKIAQLNALKEQAVADQDFQSANGYKSMIQQIKKMDKQLQKLQMEKRKAIQQQDYQKANDFKRSIEQHKQQIELMLADENDQIVEEGQNNYQNEMNDFQDNQFVDPQMNEIIKKSNQSFHKNNNRSTLKSRGGQNSRVKFNKSTIKKQKTQIRQNYDQKVIPTLANNSKVKTQESQLVGEEDQKKVQFQPEEIDGKYIQFAVIMQDHFQQDLIKRFFSRHWQLKVQALSSIQSETKKKQNMDSSFIKCLIVVVKNSIAQTNFQVALNSLVVLEDLLKINEKSNILSRTNEMTNDLDSIMRQTLKKMADNNHKIKQQAQKVFQQMVSSALYGPQACSVALVKSKQKTKLSSKQILVRLLEQQKIVESHGAGNHHVMSLAIEFGIQYCKNPAAQVRSEALNLLSICQNKNPDQLQKKLSDKQNIYGLLEAHKQKGSRPQKVKKKKI